MAVYNRSTLNIASACNSDQNHVPATVPPEKEASGTPHITKCMGATACPENVENKKVIYH